MPPIDLPDDLAALPHWMPRHRLSTTLNVLLGAYVGSRTAERVLAGQVRRGWSELIAAAILLVDLKGFTATIDHEDALRVVGAGQRLRTVPEA